MSKSLEAILAQAERTTKGNSSSAKNSTFDLNNYFTTYLPKGIDSATKRVRIIGIEDGTPFEEHHAHSAQIDGDWKTLFCPNHEEGDACPFCEVRDGFLAKKDKTDADKKNAREHQARLVYIIKVIDKDDEGHGPKFWRFKSNWEKKGVYDKIVGLIKVHGDVTDNETGRDLIIQIERNSKKQPVITNVIAADPSPLSDDAEQAKTWVEDDKTWKSVYGIKPYSYLEVVVKEGIPYWDKAKEIYVDKDAFEADSSSPSKDDKDPAQELRMGASKDAPKSTEPVAETPKEETPVEAETTTEASTKEGDDDLPW